MTKTSMTLERIQDGLLHERFQELIDACKEDTETNGVFARLSAEFEIGKRSAQELLRELGNLLRKETLNAGLLPHALESGLDAAISMRSETQANAWLALLLEREGFDLSYKLGAEVQIALAFDDREKAEELLANCEDGYWLAKLAHVKGDFEEAIAHLQSQLDATEISSRAIRAWRLGAQSHAGARNYAEEAKLLTKIVQALPKGARCGRETMQLASAHASLGEEGIAAAAKELGGLAENKDTSHLAGYAKKRLEYLETARSEQKDGKDPRHARLEFPTVHQKRNYCGPAVLELCLRSLGIDLSQDEIADVVKRETGTPMYEIVAFLGAREIEAVRMVATLDRLRAAIDLGLPVILQEEYSTTCHVAVITGYDDRLGLFVCQDPMTHRAQLKSYEWVQGSGQLFGNGVIVVVGRKADISDERREELKKAEIVDHEAFAILDEADRMRAAAAGEGQESAVVQEVLSACQKALDADPEYQLAWYRRAWAELNRYRGDRGYRASALRNLHMSRVTWRGSEWPHQLHASFLEHEGRYREAYVEHLSAHRCDPSDGENLASMSFCQGRLGDVADGIESGHKSLQVLPSHPWAAAELAVQYTQALESSSSGTWTDEDVLPWLHTAPDRPCRQSLELSEEEMLDRMRFYTSLAKETQEEAQSLLSIWSKQAALAGDFSEARKRLQEALKIHEDYPPFLFSLARACLLVEDKEGAQDAVDRLVKNNASDYRSWLAAAEVAKGDDEATWKILRRGLAQCGQDRSELIEALWTAGKKMGGGNEAAAVLLSRISEEFANDARFVRLLADRIDRVGQRGLAVQLYRRVVESEEGDLNSRFRLGTLLADDPLTLEEGRMQLGEVLKMAPSATVVRVRLATCLFDQPEAGLDVLSAAMDEGSGRVFETASHLLRALGKDDEADAMRARALGSYPSEDDARAELGAWHYYADRYEWAIDLLSPLTKRDYAGTDELEEVQDTILTAYRLAGRVDEITDWVKGLCAEKVPDHLASEVFWAFRSNDHKLAAAAARVQAANASSADAALGYEASAASCDTRGGDEKALDAVIARLREGSDLAVDAKLDAWETVFFAYTRLQKLEKAEDALNAMRKLDAKARMTLTTEEHFATLRGKAEEALSAALRIREHFPYQHMGDERLGILYGLAGEADKALEHAKRAISIAPYCHISHQSGAMAYFAAGDMELARLHMERSEALDRTEEPLHWAAGTALMHALRGDVEKFEACVADRARLMENFPYPEFEAKLRELLA